MSHRHSQPHTLTIRRCHLPSSSKFTEPWLRADWLIFYVALKHWLFTSVSHTAQKWATCIWQLKDGSNAPTHIKGDVRKCDWCYASRSFPFSSKPQWIYQRHVPQKRQASVNGWAVTGLMPVTTLLLLSSQIYIPLISATATDIVPQTHYFKLRAIFISLLPGRQTFFPPPQNSPLNCLILHNLIAQNFKQ